MAALQQLLPPPAFERLLQVIDGIGAGVSVRDVWIKHSKLIDSELQVRSRTVAPLAPPAATTRTPGVPPMIYCGGSGSRGLFCRVLRGTAPRPPQLDLRRLATFGVVHGFLRRVHALPIDPANIEPVSATPRGPTVFDHNTHPRYWTRAADGTRTFDELCTAFLCSQKDLEEVLRDDCTILHI